MEYSCLVFSPQCFLFHWLQLNASDLIATFCQLKEYLIEDKKKLLHEANCGQINSKSFCIWAGEVSKEMAYLEERHIMHGDLAANQATYIQS